MASVAAYRIAAWRRPLRTEPSRTEGRFHRPADAVPTQYLCLHPLGPWAEHLRGNDLDTTVKAAAVAQRTWVLRLELDGLVRIDFDGASEWGLTPEELVADDYGACQLLGERLRAARLPGAIVPSAALPGTENVVLFGARAAAPYLSEPVGELDVPASITAEGARALAGLLERVRFHGRPHAGLEAWRAGEPPAPLREPSWALPAV